MSYDQEMYYEARMSEQFKQRPVFQDAKAPRESVNQFNDKHDDKAIEC